MILNQYSFLLVAIMCLAGALAWAYHGSWQLSRLVLVGLVAAGIGGVLVWSQRSATSASMPAVFAQNKLVLVEYYSDF
jgi:hypothetical protein